MFTLEMFKFFLVNIFTNAMNTWSVLSCRFQLNSRMYLITQLLQHYLILLLMYVVHTISVIAHAVESLYLFSKYMLYQFK